jgi:hypothetical protein
VPCLRGLRIPVATIVGMVADGMTEAEILKAYLDLEPPDIHEALQYAAEAGASGSQPRRLLTPGCSTLNRPVQTKRRRSACRRVSIF